MSRGVKVEHMLQNFIDDKFEIPENSNEKVTCKYLKTVLKHDNEFNVCS